MNTNDLRKSLSPRGSAPIVRLDLINHFFNHDFIESCIRQIELKCTMQDGLNPLEKLGTIVLFDSAGVETDGPLNNPNVNVP